MFDAAAHSFRLVNARVVAEGRVFEGGVAVEAGRIVEVAPGGTGIDLGGDYLIPGIVDLHTDHVETHLIPRKGVMWSYDEALAAHDAVVISGGTTTVYDSLSVGAMMKNPERRAFLEPLVDALEQGAASGRFRAEHILHMRCEICDPETADLVDAIIDRDIAQLVSVMDHTPGDRQSPDIERWTKRMAVELGVPLEEAIRERDEMMARAARVGPGVRAHVVSAARAHGIIVMSHDDRSPEHIEDSVAEGISVAEFPVTRIAAERARAMGQTVVMGAPNYLRGGSQSGNVALSEILAAELVDVLASDYVPRSPLDAAFRIAEDPALPQDLPQAIEMVTRAPARLTGLEDRGEIAAGQRADLVRVRRESGRNHVVAVWVEGQRVY
ncbi:MAG: alpha-D-ribose 1-methylphosphonate 5-triphosphate diphosphatase [Pseudomonadota bacterium]